MKTNIKGDFQICISVSLIIFNVKHVLDKSKHLSKNSTMLTSTKTEFCWTDDEIQLLLESVNQYKCQCEYEGINWESIQ